MTRRLLITGLLTLFLLLVLVSSLTSKRTEARDSSAPPQGWYRVTLNGFHVFHETKDNALGADGSFDEIRLMSTNFTIDSRGIVTGQSTFKSGIICDGRFVNPDNSLIITLPQRRGLKAGDDFPAGSPWKLALSAEQLRSQEFRLPVTLYQGLLEQGVRGVVLIPSVWEMDGSQELSTIYSEQLSRNASLSFHVGEMIRLHGFYQGDYAVTQALKGGHAIGLGEFIDKVFIGTGILGLGDPKDRPIGMVKRRNGYGFVPKVLVLTYETADAIARQTGPYGAGVVKIDYQDDSDLQGHYELYLQVHSGTGITGRGD